MIYKEKADPIKLRHVGSEIIYHATLQSFIKLIVKEKLCSTDIQLAWLEHYYELWDIKQGENNPFSSVGYYKSEDLYGKNNPYEVRVKIYIDYDIKKYTGLTLLEFMNLDRAFQKQIMEVCLESKKLDEKATSKLMDELERTENRE